MTAIQMTWEQFSNEYCSRQEQTVKGLATVLRGSINRFNPDGFMLLECQQMDSSLCGSYTILPYGPNNTYRNMPDRPISPRGLASDMSVVKAFITAAHVPND